MMNLQPHRRLKWVFPAFALSLFSSAAIFCPGASAESVREGAPADIAVSASQPVVPPAGAAGQPAASLPDAPDAAMDGAEVAGEGSGTPPAASNFIGEPGELAGYGVSRSPTGRVPLSQCPMDATHARECRVHWRQLLISSAVFNAFQNAGNLYTGYWYRWETTHGEWFNRWIASAADWRWSRWSDNNPFMDQYVGHPMMGAITNDLWIQNDPKGMTLEFSNTRAYWRSRMRAMAFSTAYSFEWKLGPFGEAGVGHNGDHYFYDKGALTNETGWVELVTTPVGGLLWTVAEDAVDKHVVRKLEDRPRGPFSLLFISFLTPARSTANILRFRPPWYRDSRQVKANSFFSEPPGPEEESGAARMIVSNGNGAGFSRAAGSSAGSVANAKVLPVWPHYGGVHEFGAWWGLSLMSGHIWGYDGGVKYMPIDVTYSYLLHPGARWNFRYSPEVTALAMLDEPVKGQTNPELQRQRSYGSGVSPVGFRASFFPDRRVQPFLSTNGGALYFNQRVLSPQGSRFMYTIDFGCGLTFFHTRREAVSIGYRYQHLSNANISLHNPGTDANTFYVAVSRFRTHGYR